MIFIIIINGVDLMARTRAEQIEDDRKAIQAFRNSKPPTYNGSSFEELKKWERDMECLFAICHIRSDLKVDYASLQLEGEAFEWWRGQYHSDAHNDWASVCGALEGYFNPYAKEQRVI